MIRLSQLFLPLLKEDPSDCVVTSHKLMTRSGMIRQSASGIYSWLPLGLKVLRNIENVIREELDLIGCNEILMATVQSAELWQESGRFEAYGKEMLRIKDRHEKDLLYGPTNEEVVTDIFRKNCKSYKDLPQNLYQIQWKFRDEIRPRFGVMRGREFLMMDAYSFDESEEKSRQTYYMYYQCYLKIFARLGLAAIPMRAATGPIGGDLSHEFHILANSGESAIFYDKKLQLYIDNIALGKEVNLEEMLKVYAKADEEHIPESCPVSKDSIVEKRGIEVGHIFNFATKYSTSMSVKLHGKNNEQIVPHMGSYGIGVSRLVAAVIEASNDENGIIWPKSISPFDVIIINLNTKEDACYQKSLAVCSTLEKMGKKVLFDDTDASVGVKFSRANLIGTPLQIVVGGKFTAPQNIEVIERRASRKVEIDQQSLDRIDHLF